MENRQTGFKLVKINTEQFATLENNFEANQSVQLSVSMEFVASEKYRIIGSTSHFQFLMKGNPFMIIGVKNDYLIDEDSWAGFINNEAKTITLPRELMVHLAALTVGTTRGVLHTKTENTPYNRYFLPTINVRDFIPDDITINIEQPV